MLNTLLSFHLLFAFTWLPYFLWAIAALLLLAALIQSLRYIRKRVLLARLQKHLTPFYTAEQIKDALVNYVSARFRYAEGGENVRENLLTYFVEEVFTRKHFEYNCFILFARPGMGKTSFFINLFWVYRYQLLKKDFKIRLVALNHPAAIKAIKNTPYPDQTVLLLDGLDEDSKAIHNYKQRMDELLVHTKQFAKVIFSCKSGFLPIELERPTQSKAISFVGEDSYQLIGKIYIDPFDETDVFTYLKKRLNILELKKRVQAQALHVKMPYLFSRPLFLNYISYILQRGTATFDYTYQVFAELTNQWISRHVRQEGKDNDKNSSFQFFVEVAWDMYANWDERADLVIPAKTLQLYLDKYNIKLENWKDPLLRKHSQEFFFFVHPSFVGFLVAWRSFFQQNSLPDISFKGLSMASVCYQELCWESYCSSFTQLHGYFRTRANYRKRPLSDIQLWELQNITRLYLYDYRRLDLRFLRGLKFLKGLYLMEGDVTDLSPALVEQLPHTHALIYLGQGEYMKVMQMNSAPVALEVDGVKGVAYQWEPPQSLDLRNNPDPTQVYRPKVNGKAPSEAILQVFGMDLKKLPNETCKQIGDGNTKQGLSYQIFEQYAGFAELELFNKMHIHVFPDGSRNILFHNTYTPTLLIQSLTEVVEKLVRVYGEDDEMKGEFSEDDEAQVEDGLWLGRKWAWGNTNSYAYPLHLFMDKPGDLNLVIFGVR